MVTYDDTLPDYIGDKMPKKVKNTEKKPSKQPDAIDEHKKQASKADLDNLREFNIAMNSGNIKRAKKAIQATKKKSLKDAMKRLLPYM